MVDLKLGFVCSEPGIQIERGDTLAAEVLGFALAKKLDVIIISEPPPPDPAIDVTDEEFLELMKDTILENFKNNDLRYFLGIDLASGKDGQITLYQKLSDDLKTLIPKK